MNAWPGGDRRAGAGLYGQGRNMACANPASCGFGKAASAAATLVGAAPERPVPGRREAERDRARNGVRHNEKRYLGDLREPTDSVEYEDVACIHAVADCRLRS